MYDQVRRGDSTVSQVESVQDINVILGHLNTMIAAAYDEIATEEGAHEKSAVAFHRGVTPLFNGSPLWDEIVRVLDAAPANSEYQGLGRLYKAVYDAYKQLVAKGLPLLEAKSTVLEPLRTISSGEVNIYDAFGVKIRYEDQ